MPKSSISDFTMSKSVRDTLHAALNELPEVHRVKMKAAMLDLVTEVYIFAQKQAMEDMRQGWADTLATMLNHSSK